MKTLADFKRALTIGSRWQLVHAYGKNSMRTVAKVRSKDIGFKLDEKDVMVEQGFLQFCPKQAFYEIQTDLTSSCT